MNNQGGGGSSMPVKTNSEPIFQWSMFLDDKREQQIVVRGDNIEDFMLDVEAMKSRFNLTTNATANPTTPGGTMIVKDETITREPVEEHYCTIHNVPLELKYSKTKFTKEGKPKPYYAHIGPDGLCFGEEKK